MRTGCVKVTRIQENWMYRIQENYIMNMMCLGGEDTGELDV